MASSASLIIIGNGFDIAHGLKTKYSDFILWYFNKKVFPHMYNNDLSNNTFSLFNIRNFQPRYRVTQFNDLKEIDKFLKTESKSIIDPPNPFIKELLDEFLDHNWVDAFIN